MSVYIITYDLKKPGRNYDNLYSALQKYAYCHKVESVWLLDSSKSASDIRDDLKDHVDGNDVIFVAELKNHWASYNYECTEWLKSASRTW